MNGTIDILVNGKFLDLPSNKAIRYELINPFFTTEVYQGEYSFPFEIGATPTNNSIFKYANLPNTSDRITDFTAIVYVYGIPKFSTKLKVSRGRNLGYSIVLNGGVKVLSTADLKLNQIDFGDDFYLGNTQADVLASAKTATESGNWLDYPFAFVPHISSNFYNGLNASFLGIINRVNSANGNLLVNDAITINNKYTLVPWLYLHFILKKIFDNEGFTPKGSFWDDAECNKILITSNKAIEVRDQTYNVKVIAGVDQNLTTTGDLAGFMVGPLGSYDPIGAYDNASKSYIIQQAGKHNITVFIQGKCTSSATLPPPNIDPGRALVKYDGATMGAVRLNNGTSDPYTSLYKHTISFSITATSGDIGKAINVEFEKNTNFWQTSSYFIFERNSYMAVTLDENSVPSAPPSTIIYSQHVPDWTVGELFVELKKLGINFIFDFATKTVELSIVDKSLVFPDAIDVTGICEPENELDFEEQGKGVTFSYQFEEEDLAVSDIGTDYLTHLGISPLDVVPVREGNFLLMGLTNEVYITKNTGSGLAWDFYGHYHPQLKIGQGETEITSKLSPVNMGFADNEGGTSDQNKAIMPKLYGIGSSELYGLGTNKHTPKICFWRGLNQGGHSSVERGGVYVLATPFTKGINENTVGKYSIDLTATGMVQAFCRKLLNAINKSEILEKNMYLTPLIFEKIRQDSKLMVEYNLYIVKRISISFEKKVARAKAYLYKL